MAVIRWGDTYCPAASVSSGNCGVSTAGASPGAHWCRDWSRDGASPERAPRSKRSRPKRPEDRIGTRYRPTPGCTRLPRASTKKTQTDATKDRSGRA
jgi:hypothetical protein